MHKKPLGFPGLQKHNGFDRICVIIKGSLT